MGELVDSNNTPERVRFREDVIKVQEAIEAGIRAGVVKGVADDCKLAHFFTPIDPKYGCCQYGRAIFLPKGSLVVGKIHRHQHLNFVMTGEVEVATEFGVKHIKAPDIFVSEVGLKRVVRAIEDTIWATVHLTRFVGEDKLPEIEDEVIAKEYGDMDLFASIEELKRLGIAEVTR